MPNGALLSNSTRKIFVRAAKDDAKNNIKRIVILRIMTEKSILKVFPPPKNLNIPLKTLNKKFGKEKIKTYLCSRYKK
ncbi:hypothetical protein CUC04_08555 [Prevotella intermedia]|uniref:Uncharacterized protein n=2 Tax=Prevotella intermedia TaxID=28131 RepID=A0A2G9ICD1_PREIN|nr:hypothetical protein CUC04_08555 [Prevotella intermedia]